MSTVIDLQAVDFSYGTVPVLSAIDLQVTEGEFLGIVGPNAGGKSTLLKLILICGECGEVAEMEDPSIAKSLQAAGMAVGFHTKRPLVELLGICAKYTEKEML